MQALRKLQPARGLSFADVDRPQPGTGEVLIEVAAAGICGSDLHVDHWTQSYHFVTPALPVTLGHEFSGTVVEHGATIESDPPPVGTRVIVMPSVTCGDCAACRSGDFDACVSRTGIGMTRDGAFARYVAAPIRNCLSVPSGLAPEIAALTEPLTVAWQAVRRGDVSPGARVLVLGPGTIGQGIALMARRAGAEGVAVAGRDDAPRLKTARSLGFDDAFDLAAREDGKRLGAFAGSGFDVVFEAAGAPAAIATGLELLRPGGILVCAGIHDAAAPFDVTRLVRRQLDIRGSYRAPIASWKPVIEALARDPDAYAPMITRRMPLDEGLTAFELAHKRADSKILLIP